MHLCTRLRSDWMSQDEVSEGQDGTAGRQVAERAAEPQAVTSGVGGA